MTRAELQFTPDWTSPSKIFNDSNVNRPITIRGGIFFAIELAHTKKRETTKVELMDTSVNVIALVKDGERYVFLFDEESAPQLLQTLGHYAADPELNFTWYDAAVLSQKVRRLQSGNSPPEDQPFRRSA